MVSQYLKAPFTHKTHLITIILIGAAFVAWRLSGGGFSFGGGSGKAPASTQSSPTMNGGLSELEALEMESIENARKRKKVRDKLKSKVLGQVGSGDEDEKKDVKDSNSLGDIEKLVGLR